MEPYTAPAFYMLPCIDNISDNTIYINTKDTSDRLSLFTTLAHEGYPGHLYQTVYCHQYWKNQQITPLRSILYYGGFTEGSGMNSRKYLPIFMPVGLIARSSSVCIRFWISPSITTTLPPMTSGRSSPPSVLRMTPVSLPSMNILRKNPPIIRNIILGIWRSKN